jgi:hypothetical protein
LGGQRWIHGWQFQDGNKEISVCVNTSLFMKIMLTSDGPSIHFIIISQRSSSTTTVQVATTVQLDAAILNRLSSLLSSKFAQRPYPTKLSSPFNSMFSRDRRLRVEP